ncbi:aldehyde dehydrogenase [candidate division KSB1 bacterium]|nr:aldehyde dehydrogenase [candidate division KSB1 bacterium]RQW01320.1 MAG: aldehyde dehydrogenase [candidate division KSB1 bacterium]
MSSEPQSSYIVSINPTTEEELGRVDTVGRAGIDSALNKARAAFSGWSQKSVKERQKFLVAVSDLILQQQEEIATLIAREQGKPIAEAMASEIIAVLAILKDTSRHAHKILRPHRMRHEQLLFVHKKSAYRLEPHGVVAIISPWNYSFSVPVPEIAAALVAGNTVLFKPAPDTVLVGRKIDNIFQRAGLPPGVLNTVFVHDTDAPYITHHPQVDKIIFTGSTPVGRDVMTAASHQMTPVVLELGGKDAAIVAKDADLPRAAKGIVWGSMFNSGQVCAAVERVYVERAVAEKFIQLCHAEIKQITVGDPLDANTQIGPLTNLQQLIKVRDQVEDAIRRGARLLHGGNQLDCPGYFYEPTLLTNVDHSMRIMTEETFGPVLPIMAVDSVDQAINLANDSIYGLSAYAWTSNAKLAARFMDELQAGTVMINDATSSWGEPNAPWGGYKMSGIGRTRARFGLEEMVQVKYVSYDKGGNCSNIWWFPYDIKLRQFFGDAMHLLYSRNILVKLTKLVKVLMHKRFLTTTHWVAVLRNIHKLF